MGNKAMDEKQVSASVETPVHEAVVVDSRINDTSPLNKRLSKLAMLVSIPLGIAYIVLFLWHTVGVSYLVFAVLLGVSALLPKLAFEQKTENGFWQRYFLFLAMILIPTFTFLFRFNDEVRSLTFLAIPFVYSVFIVNIYNSNILRSFGALYILQLPFVLVGQFFVRSVEYLKRYSISILGGFQGASVVKRLLLGTFISIPFLLIFFALFASADPTFGKEFGNIITDFIEIFFTDGRSFFEFISKLIIGSLVALHLLVWHFYSWKEESELATALASIKDFSSNGFSKSWDYTTGVGFLTLINLLFAVFVISQFRYFFSGELNVIGDEAQFTYAEYARRGFTELVIAAGLVYAILFVLNIKTDLATKVSKVIFAIATSLLAIFTTLIGFSSIYRLFILQDIYGFSEIRTWGIIGTFLVTILVISTIGLVWFTNYLRNSSLAIAFSMVFLVSFYSLFPMDYYLAKGNYERFQETGQIDLAHMVNLNDEALTVLIDLAEDRKFSESGKIIIFEELNDRYDKYQREKDWRSYSPYLDSQYDRIVGKLSKETVSVDEDIKNILKDYYETIKTDGFGAAYDKYWSVSTKKIDFSELENVSLTSYSINSVPVYQQNAVLNYRGYNYDGGNYSYWDGQRIDINIKYTILGGFSGTWAGTCSINEELYLKLEDGNWKIIRSNGFVLGNFKDGGTDYYGDVLDNSHIIDNFCY
jgi:hypothetical protein